MSNYAPYPAEATAPAMGSTVSPTAGKVTLSWAGSDVDGVTDLKDYDIYIDTTSTLPNVATQTNHTSTSYEASVESGKTYYWKIVSRDQSGNLSESPTWFFIVN